MVAAAQPGRPRSELSAAEIMPVGSEWSRPGVPRSPRGGRVDRPWRGWDAGAAPRVEHPDAV